MTRAGSSGDPKPSRAEQRAREKAEWAEHDALIKRLGVLWPNYGCFCGTLEDLRRTVADLERRAERDRPNHHSSTKDHSAAPHLSADRAGHDNPQTTARLAVARAQQRLEHRQDGQDREHDDPFMTARRDLLTSGRSRREASDEAGGEVDD